MLTGILPYDLLPRDAHAYWAVDPVDPYGDAELGAEDSFLYAPVAAQLLGPLTNLPFDAFRWGYVATQVVALALGGIAYTLVVPGVIEDIVRGNIHILLALAILASFRFPVAWTAVLLTKVTPGIGLIWFAVRREWLALGQAFGGTLVVVCASILLGGIDPWVDWVRLLATSAEAPRTYTYLGIAPPALVLRLPLAAVVVAWGAASDRRWTVPLGAFLALPVIWPSGFALLAAIPPLVLADRDSRKASGSPASAPGIGAAE